MSLISNISHGVRYLIIIASCLVPSLAGPLENYVRAPDATFQWKKTERKKVGAVTVSHLEMVSQTWRGQFWSHHLMVVQPTELRHPEMGLLFITGDGEGDKNVEMLGTLAERAGAVAAVITKIPNQPLYDGKKEDSLIAYTCDQYLKTEDETWPLLFPMVKSAVRGMDTVDAFVQSEGGRRIEKFLISGASKRGWTTWLTAAADVRVKAIAPMVIDMLNMRKQTDWAEMMYGKQSEQIKDYTDLNLVSRIDDPKMKRLRSMIDPYSYRERYTMPKLLLLGTNDPYWVVDSLRHYWDDLPEPKLIFQTPNAGHDLGGGKDATQSLAAFYQMIADNEVLPKMDWKITYDSDGNGKVDLKLDRPAEKIRLWTAESMDRDFRDEKWTSKDVASKETGTEVALTVSKPSSGYRAFMAEAVLKDKAGHEYRLSSGARVTPDGKRP
jgi:PhoPQ-activated pathogenicity-related protein